jgi:sugar lactone lactonase YvrE
VSARLAVVLAAVVALAACGAWSEGDSDAPPPVARLEEPFAVALDADGRVVVADRAASRVVRIDPDTAATTVLAEVPEPVDVTVGPDGAVYVVAGERVHRVDERGTAPVAGTGARGYGGDGGPATSAPLNAAGGVAVDAAGNVYVAEYENRIRRIDAATGVITTIAGNGEPGFGRDGGPASRALLHHPHGIAVAGDGAIVVADTENDRLRRIDTRTGTIATIAELDLVLHADEAPDGSLYVVGRNRVYRLGEGGELRAIAGSGLEASTGDGGRAARASLDIPNHVAVARDGTYYVSEFQSRRVRRVDGRTGVITTIAS